MRPNTLSKIFAVTRRRFADKFIKDLNKGNENKSSISVNADESNAGYRKEPLKNKSAFDASDEKGDFDKNLAPGESSSGPRDQSSHMLNFELNNRADINKKEAIDPEVWNRNRDQWSSVNDKDIETSHPRAAQDPEYLASLKNEKGLFNQEGKDAAENRDYNAGVKRDLNASDNLDNNRSKLNSFNKKDDTKGNTRL